MSFNVRQLQCIFCFGFRLPAYLPVRSKLTCIEIMDLPQVDTCCFGLVPLKTGSMIIGFICFIMELGVHGYASYSSSDYIRVVYSVLIVCGLISSLLLVWGVFSDNKFLVKIYLIVFSLLVIFAIVVLVLMFLQRYTNMTTYVIDTVIYCCIILYCLIVVNSYYRTMA